MAFLGAMLVVLLNLPAAVAAPQQVLSGHVPGAVKNSRAAGRLEESRVLELSIGLPLRNQEELTTLLGQISDPASPQFRKYLTPEQFTERFGPTEPDYAAVVAFMEAHGFTITATHANRVVLDVSGTIGDIERTFHLSIGFYPHPKEARLFYAPDVEPSTDLRVPVADIAGLDDYVQPRPAGLRVRPRANTAAAPAFGTGSAPGGAYMGYDFRAAYVPGVSLNGSGQIVGLLEFDGYYAGDILSYESLAGLPNVPLANVLLNHVSGRPGANNVEVALDIEMAISVAPGLAKVMVYEGTSANSMLSRMLSDNQAKQISASWTYSITSTTTNLFRQLGAQGISFFNASGDSDAYSGAPSPPTDDPYLTSVGGTTLNTTGPSGSWQSEVVWNWGYVQSAGQYIGTGGGISTTYPLPTWQQGLSMTANGGSTSKRNLPDVALTADNVYVTFNHGSAEVVGGTSCAAPLWAGFMALVNQQAAANGRATAGFINPAIYTLAEGADYANCFHDITAGNNTSSGSPSAFFAAPGFDLCTGWGTPNGSNLINALTLSPMLDFTASVTSGIVPLTVTFTNFSRGAISYSWVLGDGHTSTDINAVNTYTNPGIYTVSLIGTGLVGTNTLTRTAYIVVDFPPPDAEFVASPTVGAPLLLVSFSNLSLDATDYLWDFGDGNFSSSAQPANVYTNAGTYSVTLAAVGAGGTNILTLTDYIVVTNPPSAPALQLASLLVSAAGTFQFVVTNADGTSITPDQQSRIAVFSTTDPSASFADWVQVTNSAWLTNGLLQINDLDSPLYRQRFYRAVHAP